LNPRKLYPWPRGWRVYRDGIRARWNRHKDGIYAVKVGRLGRTAHRHSARATVGSGVQNRLNFDRWRQQRSDGRDTRTTVVCDGYGDVLGDS